MRYPSLKRDARYEPLRDWPTATLRDARYEPLRERIRIPIQDIDFPLQRWSYTHQVRTSRTQRKSLVWSA
ncbi:hypothetical protein [Moorena producens]|uniref:hypothetical protein n=1 Tax=Moorena producens TaxID=1155739 RepID=UPI003C75AB0B